jgi:hypothetical protein
MVVDLATQEVAAVADKVARELPEVRQSVQVPRPQNISLQAVVAVVMHLPAVMLLLIVRHTLTAAQAATVVHLLIFMVIIYFI